MRALALVVALTASMGFAQTVKYATLPAGYETKVGNSYYAYLGAYQKCHYQLGDGTAKGTVRLFTGLDFRRDNAINYSAYSGMGRSFTRVTLDLCETDLDKWSVSWAPNRLTKPTRVFDSKVTWPTITGRVTAPPWGLIKMPFSGVWAYTGKRDICFEYDFAGGVLNNKASWSGNTARPYFMDGVFTETSVTGTAAYHPSSSTCNDSAITHTSGAFSYGAAIRYGDRFVPYYLRDSMLVYHYTNYTAPNETVLQVLCLNGSAAGVNIGAKCNKLHVDLSTILQFTQLTANATGYSSYTTLKGYFLLPYYAPWGGATLWTQGAWTDSKTKTIALTRGRSFKIPTRKPVALRKLTSVGYSGLAGRANFFTGYFAYHSMPRLSHK